MLGNSSVEKAPPVIALSSNGKKIYTPIYSHPSHMPQMYHVGLASLSYYRGAQFLKSDFFTTGGHSNQKQLYGV